MRVLAQECFNIGETAAGYVFYYQLYLLIPTIRAMPMLKSSKFPITLNVNQDVTYYSCKAIQMIQKTLAFHQCWSQWYCVGCTSFGKIFQQTVLNILWKAPRLLGIYFLTFFFFFHLFLAIIRDYTTHLHIPSPILCLEFFSSSFHWAKVL